MSRQERHNHVYELTILWLSTDYPCNPRILGLNASGPAYSGTPQHASLKQLAHLSLLMKRFNGVPFEDRPKGASATVPTGQDLSPLPQACSPTVVGAATCPSCKTCKAQVLQSPGGRNLHTCFEGSCRESIQSPPQPRRSSVWSAVRVARDGNFCSWLQPSSSSACKAVKVARGGNCCSCWQ
jgi:hypothetical protein